MIRTIYRFYCYKCFKLNISTSSYRLDISNNLINRIFCPNCESWVYCDETNLSPNHYKIIKKSEWSIIDEDKPNNTTIYTNSNYQDVAKVCDQLNKNIISVSSLNQNYNTFKTVDWYINTFKN